MAKQSGIIPLSGTIGNINFYKSKDGYMARVKGGVAASRVKTDPAFQRTRENMAEFGRAGKAGKVLRASLRALLKNVSDNRMIARLTRQMMQVIKADSSSDRGMRNVIDGEAQLLEGFEFNANSQLGSTLFAAFSSLINRASGELRVTIGSFIPATMLAAPAGATHFKIVSAGVEVDFERALYTSTVDASPVLALNTQATAALDLLNPVPAASTHPLFLVLGIEFYQGVNGTMYSLNNGAFNALSIVKVSVP